MSNILEQLPEWLSERPKWLQIAAKRLLEQSEFSDDDYSTFAMYCRKEAEDKLSETVGSLSNITFSRGAGGTLRLCSISEIKGVNALAPRRPLEFGKENFSIVYGKNGSGKSGYVRLLKHVCGAREKGELYGNVYEGNSVGKKARISFEQNGKHKSSIWTEGSICEDLSSVDIFDTSFGAVLTSKENEVSYEPPVLSFFSSLIIACQKVTSILEQEIANCSSRKPNIPDDLKLTPEGKWYDAIRAGISAQEIDKFCAFAENDENNLRNLQKRIAEKAPDKKAKQYREKRDHIEFLAQKIQKNLEQLSTEKFQYIVSLKKRAIDAKRIAAEAENVFANSDLKGVGSDIWKELWEAARKYSEAFAYTQAEYPNISDDSRCVLCQQTLSQEAKKRFSSFERFVKGEIEQAAKEAEEQYASSIQDVEQILSADQVNTYLAASGLSHDEVAVKVQDFFAKLRLRKELFETIESQEAIPAPLVTPEWIDDLDTKSQTLEIRAKEFDEDAKTDKRLENEANLKSLKTRKWLFERRADIVEEVNRLEKCQEIERAKRSAQTGALSKKKGELAKFLITDAYVQRFNTELKTLGASQIKVTLVKSKVSKGRVLHELQLRGASNANLSEVLSEGENRIVSIAAFLADVTGKSGQAPFIFDDPISSLDQDYEEAVVKRLLELSEDRQIIVFTHRLSLLGTVKHLAREKGIGHNVVCIRSVDWGSGEPAPIPLLQNEIKTALNILINQRWKDAKRKYDDGEFDEVEVLLTSICSDFRALVERSIENDLLCGVVQRFQRPVSTLRLRELRKLKAEDCSFLDSLMTKYSKFEHSQPTEIPVEKPKLGEILEDLESLKRWRDEYVKRAV